MRNRLIDEVTKLFNKISRDALATQAAALAFYTALSLAPLLFLFLSVLSTLNIEAQGQLIQEVRRVFGDQASLFMESLILSAKDRPNVIRQADIWGIGVLVVSASAVFLQIQATLNQIFGCQKQLNTQTWRAEIKSFIRKRLFSFAMVLVFVSIMVGSLLASLFVNLWIESLGQGVQVLQGALVFLLYALIFTALFEWLPDREIPWSAALKGGVVTAILFSIGKSAISWYLSRAAFASAYGAAGSFLMLLVWVYYSSVIIYIGAEIASLTFVARARWAW